MLELSNQEFLAFASYCIAGRSSRVHVKVAHGVKHFESDEFQVKNLVIVFNLIAIAHLLRSAEDEFDSMFLFFIFEKLEDELFPLLT